MKISHLNMPNPATVSSAKKTNDTTGFKQIFNRQLAAMSPAAIPDSAPHQIDTLKQSDRILNLLDNYASALDDPKKTLKDIGPLVADIEKEVRLMESKASDHIRIDPKLKKLAQDVAITADVAVFKFQRGDYI